MSYADDMSSTRSGASNMSRQEMKSIRDARAAGATAAQALAGAKMVRGLYTEDSVTVKKITVVVVNVLGSHRAMKNDWRDLKSQQTALLQKLPNLAKKFKGVVDSFQGDHFIVTFNAVLTLASHQVKAGHFALALSEDFANGFNNATEEYCHPADTPLHEQEEQRQSASLNMPAVTPGNPLTIGIATSDCLVGNMGVEGFKRFNIVGPAFTNAHTMERLCKQFRQPILTNASTAQTMAFDTHLDAVGAYRMTTSTADKVSVLYRVLKVKDQQNDEWMYDLKEQEEKDMGALLNNAWADFANTTDDDVSVAKASVEKLMKKCSDDEKCLTQEQRTSLITLSDALKLEASPLQAYLQAMENRYYGSTILQGEAGKKL